ncbi:GNAT family N-acetyltransferase [Legionella fairfieldensis]|uniref:GNAT family N-acetyltransferase n=1 Tax=Legionella fairfieldensis TaxID=45064 RepID=UPI00048AF073|nr:GNAT family N-acetyltransferase [Legionella fairfieldensis]
MLICNNQLSATQLQAVDVLAALCHGTDGGLPALYRHILEQKRITDNNVLYFQENNLLGFLSVYFFYADACEVSILVAPTHRRQGIAKQLLRAILPLLTIKQITTLIFSTPPVINETWLTRLGFHYRHSEYHMQRQSYEPVLLTRQVLSIKKATPEDIPALCAIDERCFKEKQDNMPARFDNLLSEGNYTLLLAYHGEKAVGKAHIRWHAEETILSDIAILPSYQGQGWGGELLACCINHALMQGKTKLALDVETSNHNALNLYTRHGFKSVNATDYWTAPIDKLHNFS